MFDVLLKSFTFVLIIIIGFSLKKMNILKKEDASTLSKIIMTVTLPCALLTSANGIQIDGTILFLILIGILTNCAMILFTYLTNRHEPNVVKGALMLTCASYNIGNFALPFIQSFFPGMGVVYLCAFDIGNALMALGITYAISDHIANGEGHFDVMDLFKKLFSSLPFDVYLLIFILGIFKISVPAPILSIASTIGGGNSFLAMLMIGLMLEINIAPSERKHVFKILGTRLFGAIVLSAIIYFILPLPELAKTILVLTCFTPPSTISAVFTKKIGYEGDMSATANSLNIIISVGCIVGLLLLFI